MRRARLRVLVGADADNGGSNRVLTIMEPEYRLMLAYEYFRDK